MKLKTKAILAGGAALAVFIGAACARVAPGAFAGDDGLLIERMHEGATMERVLAELVGMLRGADRDGDGLDAGDVKLYRDIARAGMRGSAIGSALGRDLDGDFKVTRAELERASRGEEAMRDREVQAQLGRLDANGDEIITLAEMAASASVRGRPDDDRLDRLLALDPNRDGRLTAPELSGLVAQRFAAVDQDEDGLISAEEYAPIADRVRQIRMEQSLLRCVLPSVPAGARLIVYGGYEGDSVSSAVIGGPDEETNLIDVVIEPGSTPLYIVLASYESMLWRVRGATQRVAQVVVSSSQADPRGISASGVAGLPRSKVAIAEPRCPGYFKGDGGQEQEAAEAVVRRATGRKPDAMFGSYSVRAVALPSGTLTKAERDKAPVPRGFDAAMWREAVRFWPGGLVAVDPRQVVARTRVKRYRVLPSQMGLAQLLGSGAIQRTANGRALRIVRPIPHLPPSMGGAHSATLILAEGVKMPPGNPVHACILNEEGVALTNSSICEATGGRRRGGPSD